jgi:hypothetical protein
VPDVTTDAESQASPGSAEIAATQPGWMVLPDAELLQLMLDSAEEVEAQAKIVADRRRVIGAMEAALVARLKERKATRLPHPDFEIVLVDKVADPTILAPELYRDLDELVKAGDVDADAVKAVVFWTDPKPELKVQRKVADVKRLKGYGEKVAAIYDKWVRPGAVVGQALKITEKKKPQKDVTGTAGEELPDYDG